MTADCVPPTRFGLMLLSTVAVVTCIQPKAVSSSAENVNTHQHEDTRTLITSPFKPPNEERVPIHLPVDERLTHAAETIAELPISKMVESLLPEEAIAAISSRQMKEKAVYYLRGAPNTAKAVAELFHQFGVQGVPTNFFGSKPYIEWSETIRIVYPDSSKADKLIFSQLLDYFKDDLVAMLAAAKLEGHTQAIGDYFQSMLIDTLIIQSIDEGTDVLQNPLLLVYYLLTPEFCKKSAAFQLRIQLGKNGIDLNAIAAEGEVAKAVLANPLPVKPNDVEFMRLGLHKVASIKALLQSPNFQVWKAFVNEPDVFFSRKLLPTLRECFSFSDLELLEGLIELGEFGEKYRNHVQSALVVDWIINKTGVAKVLEILGLDKDDGKLIKSPWREVLDAYMSHAPYDDENARVLIDLWFNFYKGTLVDLLTSNWCIKWYKYAKNYRDKSARKFLLEELEKVEKKEGNPKLPGMLETALAVKHDLSIDVRDDLMRFYWVKHKTSVESLIEKLPKQATAQDLLAEPLLNSMHMYSSHYSRKGTFFPLLFKRYTDIKCDDLLSASSKLYRYYSFSSELREYVHNPPDSNRIASPKRKRSSYLTAFVRKFFNI